MLTALAFIIVIGVVIFFHELGHFLVAKKAGIRVEKFSLGFPPNIFTRKYGDTTYCIGTIPLGGYVKMAGENPDEARTGASDEFMSKPALKRAAVIFAGPFMNYVLAILLLIPYFYFRGEPIPDETRNSITEVLPDSPAKKVGLQPKDEIIGINGVPLTHFDSLRTRIMTEVEKPITLTWIHQGDTLTDTLTTVASEIQADDGGLDTIGIIGIRFRNRVVGYRSYSLHQAAVRAANDAHEMFYLTLVFVKRLMTREVSVKMIGGPLFIAQQSGKEAQKGIPSLIYFISFLSINLAILNILPIPMLDGGHLLFILIEKVRGSPLSMKTRAVAQQIGLVVLLSFVIYATYNDLLRVLGG